LRILVVDDHEIVRRGVRALLSANDHFEICGEAADGRDAIRQAQELKPDAIVMDVSMPNLNGFEATKEIKRVLPETLVVMMSQHDVPEVMSQAMRAGATSYIVKSSISTELIAALDRFRRREEAPGLVFGSTHANLDVQQLLEERNVALVKALDTAASNLDLVTSHAAAAVARCSRKLDYLWASPGYAEWLETPLKDIVGRPIRDVLGPTAFAKLSPYFERVTRGEKVVFEEQVGLPQVGRRWIHAKYTPTHDHSGAPDGWVEVILDTTDRKRTEELLRQSQLQLALEAEALGTLNELSSHLWTIEKFDDGLDQMLEASIRLLGADKGGLQLFDKFRQTLTVAAQQGFDQHCADLFRDRRLTESNYPTVRALVSGCPVVVEDIQSDELSAEFRRAAGTADFRSLVSMPMAANNESPVGVVTVCFHSTHRPDEKALRRLMLYARQAAGFIERCRAEEALREGEQRFRAIVEFSNDAIVSKDLQGMITSWNKAAERIFGFSAQEAIGRSITIIIPTELWAEETDILRRLALGQRIDHYETVRQRKDGSRLHVSLTISPIQNSRGKIVGASKIARDISQRKEMEYLHREAELAGRLIHLQDEERRRIARDLHDSVGQSLAAAAMNLSVIAKERPKLSQMAQHSLEQNLALVEQASSEIRTMSYLLHPPLLDVLGLKSALQEYVNGFAERSDIAAVLEFAPDVGSLPPAQELSLFRVVQECLTNIHRHSGSPTALIRLAKKGDFIELEVSDQGRGMTQEAIQKLREGRSSGVGLRGMRERVGQLGGSLEICSQGSGIVVRALLPAVGTNERLARNDEVAEGPMPGPFPSFQK